MVALNLRQKIGQLMIVGFNGITVTPEIKQLIEEYRVGGIILFGRNIGTKEEVLALTTELQKIAKNAGYSHPLLICIDQENGVVRRLGDGATIFPGSMLLGATRDSKNAYEVGYMTGLELKALGINWNLAPVLDVNNNPLNPVIGVRSFGESADLVKKFGYQAMKGLQDAGVISCLKHFPGHGDTNVDSHLDLPIIKHSMERLKDIELKPFSYAIENGAETIMSAHVYFPAIENCEGVPATLSKKVITNLLREQLGFSGVVTTDCLEMNAISKGVGTERGAVLAIGAGVDLLMVSHTFPLQINTILEVEKAILANELSESRIDESLERVTLLKEKYLSWSNLENLKEQIDVVGHVDHKQKTLEIYRKGVTIVEDQANRIPIDANKRVLVVFPENGKTMMVEDKRYAELPLHQVVRSVNPNAQIKILSNPPTEEDLHHITTIAKEFDYIIIGTLSARDGDTQVKLVKSLVANQHKVIVVAVRSPYDYMFFPEVQTYLCTYEFTQPALEVAFKAIYGQEHITGVLPITIPEVK